MTTPRPARRFAPPTSGPVDGGNRSVRHRLRAGPAPPARRGPGRHRTRARAPQDRERRFGAHHRGPPGRREQRPARPAQPRPRRPGRAREPDPRRRRPERNRARAVRRAAHPADRRASHLAPARCGGAVLRHGVRLRVLVQRRGDPREVGRGEDARRGGADDPHAPSGRGVHPASFRDRRRPAPPGDGTARARGLRPGGRSGPLPRACRPGPPALAAGAPADRRRGGRPGIRRRADRAAGHRRLGSRSSAARTPTSERRRAPRTAARGWARCAADRAGSRRCSSKRAARRTEPHSGRKGRTVSSPEFRPDSSGWKCSSRGRRRPQP